MRSRDIRHAQGQGAGVASSRAHTDGVTRHEGEAVDNAENRTGNAGESLGAVSANASATNRDPAPKTASAVGTASLVSLKSLAPRYDEAQHGSYVGRLESAVQDPKSRNIALSGPYGTGKSSVLDKFEENHKNSTLRLAISTLAPDAEGASLTNRIQKELVKQLVYSASPRTLRHSRFSRIAPISLARAFRESVVSVGVLVGLLALLGRLPSLVGTDAGHPVLVRTAIWVLFAALLVGVAVALRMVTYNRFVVSDVSAAGATVTLSERTNTYFDEYLDEIVYFFDQEPIDIVILEDLDRFNDPAIFQALRELNTLLSNTPARLKKGIPIRFVYAMRDSLFEKLGTDTLQEGDDAARAETVRANRTKFFDVVIPVVPFISHRTAREHLHHLFQEAGISGIDRPLVELVARHTTDMRLLLNMRNEYLVFAERLLESDKVAPGLAASHLFALVAYKNFHLEDFEKISRRSSDLDRLYDYRRDLVRSSVAQREKSKRDLLATTVRPRSMTPFANRLGRRLIALGKAERDKGGVPNWHLRFTVNSTQYDSDQVVTPEFWDAVVEAPSVNVGATQTHPGGGQQQSLIPLSQEHLEGLFPEALQGRWEERNADAVREELQQLDREIDLLRGADFRDLVGADQFTLTLDEADVTFARLVNTTLKSDLARDLVEQGYIDRNFTLYAAQFYGDFTGVDIATFIVQTVQTNTMDIDYRFTSDGAVANLLAETSDDFTRTSSAYNVQVLDYLLVEDTERADQVVNHMVSNFGDDAREFLTAYLTSGKHRTRLAARLGQRPWRQVFSYLATADSVPADARVLLVDAALLAADPEGAYDLGSGFADFVAEHYKEMSAFTTPHPESDLHTVVTVLEGAEALLPRLEDVHEQLRALVVEKNLYELTATNLRSALGITGEVTLDQARGSDAVWRYCLANPDAYLDAVEDDRETDYSVRTPETLAAVLNEAESWDKETIERLLTTASSDSTLPTLDDAPATTWMQLAAATLFRASLANVEAYRAQVGEIDKNLGELLLSAGAIHIDEPDADERPDKATTALAVLNAGTAIPSPEDRVKLVRSLDLDGPLTAAKIQPEANNMFALLMRHKLVTDDATTFMHLRSAGWPAVKPAILASTAVEEFLAPDLVDGMVADLFKSTEVRGRVGKRVLDGLPVFLPTDDAQALSAAAQYAGLSKVPLPLDQIHRVARACQDTPELTLQLLQIASPAPAVGDIVAVLAELGTPYSHVSTRAETEFEVSNSDASKAVFEMLAVAGVCGVTKKPRKPLLVVKLT